MAISQNPIDVNMDFANYTIHGGFFDLGPQKIFEPKIQKKTGFFFDFGFKIVWGPKSEIRHDITRPFFIRF